MGVAGVAGVLAVAVGGGVACGQGAAQPDKPSAVMQEPAGPRPPDFRGRQNAALVYFRAWDSIDRAVFKDVNENYENKAGARLTEKQLEAVKGCQRFVDAAMHAAALEDCDWGVDFSEGPNALLPHLGLLRGTCRFLGADVRRCVAEGDIPGAARRVIAVVRMSGQLRGDRCLISSLVAVAINGYSISLTRNMMEEKSLTPQAGHEILAAFQALPEDPFGFRTCLDMERNMLTWTRNNFHGEHAGEEFAKAFAAIDDVDSPQMTDVKKMSEAAMSAELDKASGYYDELDKIWGKAGKEKEFGELERRLVAGEFGQLAKVIAPAVSRANQSGLKALAQMQEFEKELGAYVRGEPAGGAGAPKDGGSR
jgi:hypothetical protein